MQNITVWFGLQIYQACRGESILFLCKNEDFWKFRNSGRLGLWEPDLEAERPEERQNLDGRATSLRFPFSPRHASGSLARAVHAEGAVACRAAPSTPQGLKI